MNDTGARLRRLADALPVWIAYVDPSYRYVFVNETYTGSFGVYAGELVGRLVSDVVGAGNYAIIGPRLTRALAGEEVRGDQRIELASGERRYVQALYMPDVGRDGQVVGCFVMAVDMTDRELAEQRLRDSESRLRMAKEAAELGIHDYDLRTGEFRWDARCRALWGLGLDEPLTLERFVAGIHPDDRAAVDAELARATDPAGDGRFAIEHRVVDPNADQLGGQLGGEIRWIAVRSQVYFDAPYPSGPRRPTRMVGTIQDISARKRSEAALQRSEERLREADRRKDEFLAMLGHELRNPLAAIRSAAELLLLDAGEDARLRRLSAILDRQSTHMARLVDGLLEVSRIARGKIDLLRGPVDLVTLLLAVIEDHRAALAEAGLALHTSLPAEPLWVWADEIRLTQVFANLISNAIKFTRPGGEVEIRARAAQGRVEIVIRDTGVGMDEATLAAIFEPFAQGPQPLARSAGGLGIGLALVRGLVELHGGAVAAASPGPGQGSTFTLWLPTDAT